MCAEVEAASSAPTLSHPLPTTKWPMSQMLPLSTGKPKVRLGSVCPRCCCSSSSRHAMNMLAVGDSRTMNGIHLRVSRFIYQVSGACSDAQLPRNVGSVDVFCLLGHSSKSNPRPRVSGRVAEWWGPVGSVCQAHLRVYIYEENPLPSWWDRLLS